MLARHNSCNNIWAKHPHKETHKGQQLKEGLYAVTQEEAEASKTVISGMISLSNKKAYALFDRGATYTFLFERYRQLSEMKTKPLEMPSSISTPPKDVMVSMLVYENI